MKFGQKRITELAEVVSGGTPKSNISEYWDGDILWATPTDVSKNKKKFLTTTARQLTKLGLEKSSAKVLPEKSVLLTSRAPIGLVAINEEAMSTNQGFKNLIPKASTSPDYLYWWLKCNTKKLQFMGTGATFKELSKATIERLTLPCPPLEEQKRIAGILDAAEDLRQKRQRSLELLDELKQSIFIDMFGDIGKNKKIFQIGKIRDLVTKTQYGTSAKAFEDGALPILRMGNITYNGSIDLSNLKFIDISEKDLPKYTVRRGDILFNRTNSKELVGKTTVVETDEKFAFAGYLVRARVNEKATPEFVSGYLNSPFGKALLAHECNAIVGQANINAEKMKDLPIMIPPLILQQEFSMKLAKLKEFRNKVLTSSDHTSELFTSLQHKAFAGELSGIAP
jgi:type I restriction enzyme, S subunit